jgi:hypothetical protein
VRTASIVLWIPGLPTHLLDLPIDIHAGENPVDRIDTADGLSLAAHEQPVTRLKVENLTRMQSQFVSQRLRDRDLPFLRHDTPHTTIVGIPTSFVKLCAEARLNTLPAASAEHFEDLAAVLKICEEQPAWQKGRVPPPFDGRPVPEGRLVR